MEIKVFDREFVERTKKIIEHPTAIECEYDITLLLNCMLALVLLPTEKNSSSSKTKKFRAEITQKIKDMGVILISTSDEKLFRTIKNALSHMHVEIKNANGEIHEILFWDKYPEAKEYHTILKFTTQEIREFALFVANKHLERLSNKVR